MWLVAALAGEAAAAEGGYPQLRVAVAVAPEDDTPRPDGGAGGGGEDAGSPPMAPRLAEAPAAPIRAPATAGAALMPGGSGDGDGDEAGEGADAGELPAPPRAASAAATPTVSPRKPMPPSAARVRPASYAVSAAAGGPPLQQQQQQQPAAAPPAIVVLPHAHTVYCDRKRQVCTAAGAVREGNRLGLAVAALGVEPAAAGELRGPRLPPGTRVTWYRSAEPAAGFESLHASLAAHGAPARLGVPVTRPAPPRDATDDAAAVPPPASAASSAGDAAAPSSSASGGQCEGAVRATPPASGGDAGAAAPPTPPADAAAHPTHITDATTGARLLAQPPRPPAAAAPECVDALFSVPTAPGVVVDDAPAPPPDPSDPHAGSPLFTSSAAARLLRAQAEAAWDDPAQWFCALGDVGHYVAAAVTVPGHSPVLLPPVGPVEPGLPRFREVWVEVHRWRQRRRRRRRRRGEEDETEEAGGAGARRTPGAVGDAGDGAWAPQPPGTAPQPGDALVARALFFGGVPSPACGFSWIRVDAEGERSETAPAPHLPHAPLCLPAPGAPSSSSGPVAHDPRVYLLAAGGGDVGCCYKVACDPVRWDGEGGAPTTSKPTSDVVAAAARAAAAGAPPHMAPADGDAGDAVCGASDRGSDVEDDEAATEEGGDGDDDDDDNDNDDNDDDETGAAASSS